MTTEQIETDTTIVAAQGYLARYEAGYAEAPGVVALSRRVLADRKVIADLECRLVQTSSKALCKLAPLLDALVQSSLDPYCSMSTDEAAIVAEWSRLRPTLEVPNEG